MSRLLARAVLALSLCAATLHSQDTTSRPGVRIGLAYEVGTKPGVLVLPVPGIGGDSVRAVLQRDLDFGDRVSVITGAVGLAVDSLLARQGGRGPVNYALYAQLGAAAVVQMSVTPEGRLHAVVHDVGAKRVLQVQEFVLPVVLTQGLTLPAIAADPRWRMAVHAASDEVERWITGAKGIAGTRILFVRDGRIRSVDSDGAGDHVVAEAYAMSPAWHPGGRMIAYSLFSAHGTRIAIRSLDSGSVRLVGVTPGGLNITPAFSHDGSQLVYAHGDDDGTDLVATVTADARMMRAVTVGRGSDNVSPTFSPDGRYLAFTSGRAGHPEVYISDVDGTNAELLTPLTFGETSYRSNPDWSSDGRTVAYQSQIAGAFQIMAIAMRDRSVRQLTSEGSNEDPSWAPDSRHLVFTSSRSGIKDLFILDAESGRVRQLTHGGARLSAWSPRLDQAGPRSTATGQ